MPYIIKKVNDGFKVCKRDEPDICFSKKGIPKSRAIKQMKAIGISGSGSSLDVFISNKSDFIKDDRYKRITIHTKNDKIMDKLKQLLLSILKKFEASTELINTIKNIDYYKKKFPSDLYEGTYWYEMPTYKHNDAFLEIATIFLFYKLDNKKVENFLKDFGDKIKYNITEKTDSIWYPERPSELSKKYKDKIYITENVENPKYPIYVISKGRWEKRYTSRYLEWANIPYKIVVEPQEYNEYVKVIDKSKILILPKKYLGKNQGSIPVRNFVMEHSKKDGHKRHWVLDDNIRTYHRVIEDNRVPVKSGVVFKCVEDYVDRFENIMLAGHNYSMFAVSGNTNLKPITKNSRVYSSILINNDIPFKWRGRYNEDTDLSLRVLKAGYPTVLFNAFTADKLMTLTQKGGNTDTIYAVKDALYLKAKSLADQHPDVAEVKVRFGRTHHYVNYQPFKNLELVFKKGVLSKLSKKPNNYNMRLVKGDDNKITDIDNNEGGAKPKDIKLYESIKEKVYEEQPKHSLYRSARIAKEYKKAGGEYTNDDKPKMNINKWFNQKWISINDFLRGDVIPCGNSDTKKKFNEYPLCRPLAIAELLTKTQMKKMIKEKNELKEKQLITKKVLDTDKFNIKSTLSGNGAGFFKQLDKIGYNPELYIKDARNIAKKRGYNPKLLNYSEKPNKKLNYNGVDFGQVNYNDFLIYKFLERKGDIPKDTANKKMRNYRTRATKIKGDWALSKESPNSLAIKILW